MPSSIDSDGPVPEPTAITESFDGLKAAMRARGYGVGRNPDGAEQTVATTMLVIDEFDAEIKRLRSENMSVGSLSAEWAAKAGRYEAVLETVAAQRRPDGSWNRDREACRALAAGVLADGNAIHAGSPTRAASRAQRGGEPMSAQPSTSSGVELITAIEEQHDRLGTGEYGWEKEDGFQITTTEQIIWMGIANGQSCCESWGYLMSEDDTAQFVGAELRAIVKTDINRSSRKIGRYDWNSDEPYDDDAVYLDDGEAMFVDLETDRGVLQFVAYNAHNGYYGHSVTVESRQLKVEDSL